MHHCKCSGLNYEQSQDRWQLGGSDVTGTWCKEVTVRSWASVWEKQKTKSRWLKVWFLKSKEVNILSQGSQEITTQAYFDISMSLYPPFSTIHFHFSTKPLSSVCLCVLCVSVLSSASYIHLSQVLAIRPGGLLTWSTCVVSACLALWDCLSVPFTVSLWHYRMA